MTLTGETWRILAALEGLASIADVAERLGATDFQVGKILADLVRSGLVEIVDDVATGQYYYGDDEEPDKADNPADDDESDVELLSAVLSDVSEAAGNKSSERRPRRRKGVGSLTRDD